MTPREAIAVEEQVSLTDEAALTVLESEAFEPQPLEPNAARSNSDRSRRAWILSKP